MGVIVVVVVVVATVGDGVGDFVVVGVDVVDGSCVAGGRVVGGGVAGGLPSNEMALPSGIRKHTPEDMSRE